MKRTIDVVLGEGLQVGALRYDLQGRRENAAFEYSVGWLGDPAHFSLGPTLPLQAGPQFHRKSKDGSLFHAAIADTEPDGWARRVILRDHAKRRQELRREGKEGEAHPLNALDYLLAVDDASRVGALHFRDELSDFAGSVHLSSPLQIQARVHTSGTSNFGTARHTFPL
jgi:serine/threonine-protein kinase HipA